MTHTAFTLAFAPLLPWAWVCFGGGVCIALCLYKKLWVRALLFAALTLALLQPLRQEISTQQGTSPVVIITDLSRSTASDHPTLEAMTTTMQQDLTALKGLTLHNLTTADTAAAGSTPLQDTWTDVTRLGSAVAGVILLTDGRITLPETPYPVPLHILQLPPQTTPDRRVEIIAAPAFALLDQPQQLRFIVHDKAHTRVPLTLKLPGQKRRTLEVTTGAILTLPFTLHHTGTEAISLRVPPLPQEVITANNQAAALVNGVRESVNVLLITGSPHNGTRSLRQVLKGDAGVNLVHFSILRTLDNVDRARRDEMSLIPFPVDKLFGEQLPDFDLVVLDNFINPNLSLYQYYPNIVRYVEGGGSLLVMGNPAMAGPDSIIHTPLAAILPFGGVTGLIPHDFTPRLTTKGQKHPVTQPLADQAAIWGPLGQGVAVTAPQGQVLMSDDAMHPLLILNTVGQGRVAALLTPQLWRWGREAPGGPQTDLLKRLAHWLMQAPSLEANQLHMTSAKDRLTLAYKGVDSLKTLQVTLTPPVGPAYEVTLEEATQFTAQQPAKTSGLYTARAGALQAYAVVGSGQDKEWSYPPHTHKKLSDYAARSGGRLFSVTPQHLPSVKAVTPGARTAGRGWIGLPIAEGTHRVVASTPGVAPWLWLVILLGLLVGTWVQEGCLTRTRQ